MLAEGSYGTQLFAALFFVLAGARLLRLSQKTGEAPERLLGLYFALTGIAYEGWTLPYMVAVGSWLYRVDSASWIAYSVGVIPYLLFTRVVFRSKDGWATALVIACVGALCVGTGVLATRGDLSRNCAPHSVGGSGFFYPERRLRKLVSSMGAGERLDRRL